MCENMYWLYFCYKTKKIRLTVNDCETVVLGQCFGNFGCIKLFDRHWVYIITDHGPMSHQPVGAMLHRWAKLHWADVIFHIGLT